jgi:hypothetical protein
VACALVAAGCGGDEQEFTVEGVVTELNEEGAALAVGERLAGSEGGTEVRALVLRGQRGTGISQAAPPGFSVEAAGAVVATEDEAAALRRYRQCSVAPALICYRIANAVLYHDVDTSPAQQRRIKRAVLGVAGKPP